MALMLGMNLSAVGAWVGFLAPKQQYGDRALFTQEKHGALAGAAFGSMLGTGLGQLTDDADWAFEGTYVATASALGAKRSIH